MSPSFFLVLLPHLAHLPWGSHDEVVECLVSSGAVDRTAEVDSTQVEKLKSAAHKLGAERPLTLVDPWGCHETRWEVSSKMGIPSMAGWWVVCNGWLAIRNVFRWVMWTRWRGSGDHHGLSGLGLKKHKWGCPQSSSKSLDQLSIATYGDLGIHHFKTPPWIISIIKKNEWHKRKSTVTGTL